ncbi:metallophosphoesterase MPPED2-like [Gigantopelta aegis]|uniref:metallophosphoesterase MPPED2-like n=1 Tax=Gigantopelta aegis TaxID=1735272 RepID=UPI001B88B661|nr:metallophosphoesterase MPPED2-like [Gigantopelta aegis]XP_041372368.1 metallophosphoesterase MPPED2-like [Gigantopelta aegis]XP_041372369.1 metallophosphoesterase MPPED2-like [Gigantopelta aegis]
MSSEDLQEGDVTVSQYSAEPNVAYDRLYVKQRVVKVTRLNPNTPISNKEIRFVCLSDTHSRIERTPDAIPFGDVLLHAGDLTNIGLAAHVDTFNTFLGMLPHKVKFVIAGNHDISFDNSIMQNPQEFTKYIDVTRQYLQSRNLKSVKQLLTNCVYLEDSTAEVCGIKIYGAPWVPQYCDMGFNLERGQALLDKWNHIPNDTDILITHGPPLGRGDLSSMGLRAGCVELLNTVQRRVQPKVHLFGHIHEGYGMTSDGQTTFINASNCTVRCKCTNPPIVFDLPIPAGHSKSELAAINMEDVNLTHKET